MSERPAALISLYWYQAAKLESCISWRNESNTGVVMRRRRRSVLCWCYQRSHIDPREFFGGLTKDYAVLPEDYAQALADEIQDQRQRHSPNEPEFLIATFGRVECQLPADWHRPLVEKLLAAGIWVEDFAITTLDHPHLTGPGRNGDGTRSF